MPTSSSKDSRMKWWRDARFGMFIHFGLYSGAAGKWKDKEVEGAGEWLLFGGKIDPLEYRAELLPKFNPVKFNADEWSQIAKDAGMQYVVITTKHHDGFCLWDSALTDYDTMSTPFKRDIMKELSTAVRAKGMHMGWYHSIMDWTHPDYMPRREWDKRPSDPARFPKYVEYMHGQLKELLTNYGPIDVVWFDGEWENSWTHEWGVKTDDWVRSLQPQTIVNNRVDVSRSGMGGFSSSNDARGDFGTPEQTIPANGMPGKDWETCMTMNETWGYKLSDTKWKSSADLIRKLCDIASKGGNFLLNVGPKGDGTIPQESIERLRDMGAWLKVNGRAIYGTTAGPFTRKLPWGRVTTRGNTLNLMIFDKPADGVLLLPGLQNMPTSARPMDGSAGRIGYERTADGVRVLLPQTLPASVVTVVELELDGPPLVPMHAISADENGTIVCCAEDAQTSGSIQYEERFKNLGFWYDPHSTASWLVDVPAPGAYTATIEYAAAPNCGGMAELTAVGATGTAGAANASPSNSATVKTELPARKGWDDFTTTSLGRIELSAAGPATLTLRALSRPGEAFANVRRIVLSPAE